MGLEVAAHQQVELLVRAAHFHIGFQRNRVKTLAERVEKFVDGDGALFAEAFFKIVALHHTGHGVAGGQLDEARGVHLAQPAGVELHLGLFRVQDFEDLFLVGFGVGQHLLFRERRAGFRTARRVADAAGEIADQKNDRVPQLLEMTHLVHHHRMAEVQVRSRGVKAHLDAQGHAARQLFAQFALVDQFSHAAFDEGHLPVNIHHRRILLASCGKKCRARRNAARNNGI